MNGSDLKFFFIHFLPELLSLSLFPERIVQNVEELRNIVVIMDNHQPIKVSDIFLLYNRVLNWTKVYATIYSTTQVTSKVHKLEHMVIFILLVKINYF